jgi:hypothetical protein
MKFKPYAAVVLTLCVLFSASSYSETPKDTLESPSAYLPEREYEFEPALEGTLIMHDFIIQNKGSMPLKIVRVNPG